MTTDAQSVPHCPKPALAPPPSNKRRPTRAADPDTKILTANASQFALKKVIDPCSAQVARELDTTKRDMRAKAKADLMERWDRVTDIAGSNGSRRSGERTELLFVTPCALAFRSYLE